MCVLNQCQIPKELHIFLIYETTQVTRVLEKCGGITYSRENFYISLFYRQETLHKNLTIQENTSPTDLVRCIKTRKPVSPSSFRREGSNERQTRIVGVLTKSDEWISLCFDPFFCLSLTFIIYEQSFLVFSQSSQWQQVYWINWS